MRLRLPRPGGVRARRLYGRRLRWPAGDPRARRLELTLQLLEAPLPRQKPRERPATLGGEAKWARRVDGRRLRWELERKARALPKVRPDLRYAVAAREAVDGHDRLMAITATDVFSG